MNVYRLVIAGFALGLSFPAYSLSYSKAQDLVKDLPLEYLDPADHGKLCEILGVQVMKELHPNATVYNGVVYKKKKLSVGELDLVVVENDRVTDIVEVKCWSNYSKAAHKADVQLDRFSAFSNSCDINFSVEGQTLPCETFDNPNVRLGKMSYKDAIGDGFNFDLSLTRDEILQLIQDVTQ